MLSLNSASVELLRFSSVDMFVFVIHHLCFHFANTRFISFIFMSSFFIFVHFYPAGLQVVIYSRNVDMTCDELMGVVISILLWEYFQLYSALMVHFHSSLFFFSIYGSVYSSLLSFRSRVMYLFDSSISKQAQLRAVADQLDRLNSTSE